MQMDPEASVCNPLDLYNMLIDERAEPRYLRISLLESITNNFANHMVIGSGGFAVVYKGQLQNGNVAVKKLTQMLGVHETKFRQEVECLMSVKHKNIVRFLGYCSDIQEKVWKLNGQSVMAEERQRFLCFEYLPWSLDKYINDPSGGHEWRTCYQIIKGICEGLHYLHQKKIVHLDLKPANILLDHYMVPKIADFGLSKCFDENQTRAMTSNPLGTLGYMAPESYGGLITFKSDIYSFGIIIIKILTGNTWCPDIDNVVESWTIKLKPSSSGDTQLEPVRVCAEIAIECTDFNPAKRPDTRSILERLDEMESIYGVINAKLGSASETNLADDVESASQSENSFHSSPTASHPLYIKPQSSSTEMSRHQEDVPKVMSLQLLSEITNNFSEDRRLGRGTHGKVYKGVHNGAEIAVKMLHLMPGSDDLEPFKKEFENLTRLKHWNIVKLLGYCYEVKYEYVDLGRGRTVFAPNIYGALCFEYMHNGSLHEYLSDASHGLDWQARYRIIKGICNGLKYLHEGLENPMYHLDLKPDNILLDKNMVPKIADFGLAKLVRNDQTQATQSSIGTWEYLPPEYIEHNLVSNKFDIFSIGVVMIRLMTGYEGYCKKTEMSSQEFIDLVQKSWRERLQLTSGCMSLKDECHQVKRCIEIALDCVKADRKQRPEIGTIIRWLSETEHINEKFGMGSPHKTRPDAVSLIEKPYRKRLRMDSEASVCNPLDLEDMLIDERAVPKYVQPHKASSSVSDLDVAVAPSQEQAAMEAPMSSSLGAMGPLLRKLDQLLAPKYSLRRSLKQAIEVLKEDVEEVNAALVEQSMVDSPSNKAKYWMDEVRELSYDMEDCIDHMMRSHSATDAKVRSVHHFKVARRLKINRLPKLLKPSMRMARISEIRALVREASERHERYGLDDCSSNHRFAFTGSSHGRVSALCKTSADLVGVEDSRNEITMWVTNQEEEQLKVLGIIGSAGVGKTTLIRALYRELKGQFECRAFIRMSRKPDMNKIIGEILSQVRGTKQISDDSSVQNSIDSIREHLQDKRYFIVIDDLWDATPWDILIDAFPKGNNCSRIIITAEFQDVTAECSGYHSVTFFEMKPLLSQDSEKLFLHRVFGSEHRCPDQLKEVSSRILKTSGGLPLAIVMMAGLLASELDNTDLWNQLRECFFPSLAILTMEQTLEKILNLCYNSLPQCLKTCLLYLAIFPEGITIWKVDLLKQWIAEGFVSTTEDKEGVAESYFDELVNRCMIQPEKINHDDEVLSFTVHHVVFNLISHKSREMKFVATVDYSQTITIFPMKVHRLSLQFSCATYASKPEGIRLTQVRTLAFFGLQGCMPSIIKFKHLRVLNLELWGDSDDCKNLNLSGLCRLFQLRYLKVACHIFVELPSQIHGLQFLETLEIDAKVSDIPVDIADLPSLLHLSFRDGTKFPDGIRGITSLQTLKYFDLGKNSEDNVRSLGELVNLRDLHLTCSKASLSDEHLKRNLVALSSAVGRLANLRSLTLVPGIVGMTVFVDHSYVMSSAPIFLQRLELLSPICTFSILPTWIAKLQRLRTLKCFVRELLQEGVDILAGLPVLTSLSLFVRRSPSQSVVFQSGAFPVLKYFKYRCGAPCLDFKDEALPNLRRIKLGFNIHRGDQYANMISGIEYLFKLKEIALEIGAAEGAEESDRRAAEIAFKDAIQKQTKFRCFLNIKKVDRIEEENTLTR